MFRQVWNLLRPFHRDFLVLVFLLIFYEGGQIVGNYTISFIVRLFDLQVQYQIWGLVVLGLLSWNELYMRLDNRVDWHIITRHSHPIYRFLKLSAIAKFLKMDVSWHQRHNSGTLVGQVSDGVWKTLTIIDVMSWEFVPTVIQATLSLIPMFILTPWVVAVSVIAFVLFALLTIKGEKEKKPIRVRRHDLYEEEWSQSVQSVQGHETVVMFGQQERLLNIQSDLHDNIIKEAKSEHHLGVYKYNRARIRILTTARLVIYAIWVNQLFAGTLDVANLIFVSVLTERLFGSFWRFARLADQLTSNSEGVARLMNLMNQTDPVDAGTRSVAVTSPVEVNLSGVCFAYSGEYSEDGGALHDFSMEVEPGQVVALVGPSGAGKTTIRKVVTKLIDFQEGTITIAGLNIRDWDGESLRKLFSYVPQGDDVYIFDQDLKYNIAFPRPDATDAEVEQAAKLAGIHDFIMTQKQAYQTMVGERGVRLSGGQKQRVALARAILADRPILILDEATSAVDSITEDEIQTNMRQILCGKTAIIIAHRLSTIKFADKIVVMNAGRKVEEGSHDQLVLSGGLYARMVELQTTH